MLSANRYPRRVKAGHNSWTNYGSSGKQPSTSYKIGSTTIPAIGAVSAPCRALHPERLATKDVGGAADDAGRVAF